MTKFQTTRFNPNTESAVDVESLLSAPLIAASNANSAMSREQIKFLMDFCFQKKGDTYIPVMIEMHLHQSVLEADQDSKSGATIRRLKTTFQVPMMTMIPINSLAVETVDVEFNLEISSQHQVEDDDTDKKDKSSSFGGSAKKTKLKGKISYDSKESMNSSHSDKYQSKNSANLKVNIHAGQLPLPVGVHQLIDVFSKSIHPIAEPETENNSDQTKQLKT